MRTERYGVRIELDENQTNQRIKAKMNEMLKKRCAVYFKEKEKKKQQGVLICAVVLHVFVHVAVNLLISICIALQSIYFTRGETHIVYRGFSLA